MLLLVAAAAIGAAGALLLASSEQLHLVGYVLATIVGSTAIGTHRILQGRRLRRGGSAVPRVAKRLRLGVATLALWVIGVAIGAAHVWQFADSVARP